MYENIPLNSKTFDAYTGEYLNIINFSRSKTQIITFDLVDENFNSNLYSMSLYSDEFKNKELLSIESSPIENSVSFDVSNLNEIKGIKNTIYYEFCDKENDLVLVKGNIKTVR